VYIITPFILCLHVVVPPPGGSGEGGVSPAGAGQVSVPIRHEEAPEDPAHVLRPIVRRADEGVREDAPCCPQGALVLTYF